MKRLILAVVLSGLCATALAADNLPVHEAHEAPAGARAYILSPTDGATVPRTFTVRFGLQGMGVAPAGVDRPKTGHHHLLVDVDSLPPAGKPIPSDAQHLHFGGGQTQTELTLSPGTHTLQLELGDMNHVPFDPPVTSKKITVHVE